jgi:transcriptional regulator with XRE-family HTH domain
MIKHPQLSQKFELLYSLGIEATLSSNSGLAKKLGVSRQYISRWIRGTDTSPGDRIPSNHLEPVAEIFHIKPHWFSLSYSDFEQEIPVLLV